MSTASLHRVDRASDAALAAWEARNGWKPAAPRPPRQPRAGHRPGFSSGWPSAGRSGAQCGRQAGSGDGSCSSPKSGIRAQHTSVTNHSAQRQPRGSRFVSLLCDGPDAQVVQAYDLDVARAAQVGAESDVAITCKPCRDGPFPRRREPAVNGDGDAAGRGPGEGVVAGEAEPRNG